MTRPEGTKSLYFLAGRDEMSAATRAYDWTKTPLGPPEYWPVPLKTAVDLMLTSKFPKCISWGPELITLYNQAFRPILGNKPESLGMPLRETWFEIWDNIAPIVEKAYSGEATYIEDFGLVIDRYGYPEQAYFTFCYSPIRIETGEVGGMMNTVIETTKRVETERRMRLVNRELVHRIKNTLAVTSSIANQTLRLSESLETARELLNQRLCSLAQAHSILTADQNAEAAVADVVTTAAEPHQIDCARFRASGPEVMLTDSQALALSLTINELVTNALKYGALSQSAGLVTISWGFVAAGDDEEFIFEWRESGGPPVKAPTRRGFGSRLVKSVTAQEFRGTAALDYAAEGLRYILRTERKHLPTTFSSAGTDGRSPAVQG